MTRFLRLSTLLSCLCAWLLLGQLGCKTPGQGDPTIKVPTLGTAAISDVKTTTAKATCAIREVGFGVTGTPTIKEYGICYAAKESPTTADTKISVGTSTTATLDIVANLSGLSPGTPYFVRGYVVHDGGTAYGDQAKFTTESLKAPELTTADATDITTVALSMVGKLTSLGTSDVTQHGHVLSATNQTPTTADSKTEMGAANAVPKDFKSVFTGLKATTTYYIRAYAVNATGTGYSEVKTVKTTSESGPTVTINDATDVAPTSFNITGKVTAIGTADVTQYGHVLSESNQTPTIADSKTEMGGTNAPKDFRSNFGNLAPGKTYYVRAYALNAVGISYSEVKTVKTGDAQLPTLVSGDGTQVNSTGFIIGGRINSLGTFAVTQYGHVLSESNQNPTTADTKTELGGANSVPKDFQSNFGNLKANTTYYLRAYATSAAGTAYSDAKTVKTANDAPPTVTTQGVDQIALGTARGLGSITNGGTRPITQYGHCWSIANQNPTTGDARTELGGTTAPKDFASSMVSLSQNTTYYVRAYATSAAGTGYGEVKTFKTLDLQPPTVSSPTSGSETTGTTTLSVYGRVDNIGVGGGTITQYGHCWSSTNQNPTTSDSKTTNGALASQFVPYGFMGYLSGLTPNTTYYVRVYATTNAGTGYSAVRTIKTNAVVAPTISGIRLESALLCASPTYVRTVATAYDAPCCSQAADLINNEIKVSFTYETKTETPSRFGICLSRADQSADPTIDNAKIESGNAYSSLLGGYFSARLNVIDKTGNTKLVACAACGGGIQLCACGKNLTATEYTHRNLLAPGYLVLLVSGSTAQSISYKYRAYIIMTNGNTYYGPTTSIDPTQVCRGPG